MGSLPATWGKSSSGEAGGGVVGFVELPGHLTFHATQCPAGTHCPLTIHPQVQQCAVPQRRSGGNGDFLMDASLLCGLTTPILPSSQHPFPLLPLATFLLLTTE